MLFLAGCEYCYNPVDCGDVPRLPRHGMGKSADQLQTNGGKSLYRRRFLQIDPPSLYCSIWLYSIIR